MQLILVIVGAAIVVGVATGRMHWLGAIFVGALPFLRKGFFLASRIFPFWLQKTGGKAHFVTAHLDVTVNVANRSVSGHVINGPHKGKTLSQLSESELQELADLYKSIDKKSYFFIKAVMKGFDETQNTQMQTFENPDITEALQILGLAQNPSKEAIIAAHRRLINKLHPDRGGSDFLAARVNQARDVLLEHMEKTHNTH